jgi:hypothetical protein
MAIFASSALRKPLQWLAVVSLVLTLAFGAVAIQTEVAQAGSNGQMVRLSNICPNPALITWARVSGYNQNGKYAVWQAWPNRSSVTTDGWYWIGRVKIEWRTNRDTYLHLTAYDVPKNQPNRDWVAVILDKWGC